MAHTIERPPAPVPRRSFLPREHGAYAELAFPLLTVLAIGAIRGAVVLLTAATVLAFLAHEPVQVLIGGRGGRARRESGGPARRRAVLLIGLAALAGAAGLWTAPPNARLAALFPLGSAALLAPLMITRREKTLAGELLVAVTFATAAIPVALSGGVSPRAAVFAGSVWAVVFALGTLTVRGVIATAKRRSGWPAPAVVALGANAATITGGVVIAAVGAFSVPAALSAVPFAATALVCGLLRVHPRHLRTLGWSFVAADVAVLALLVVGLPNVP